MDKLAVYLVFFQMLLTVTTYAANEMLSSHSSPTNSSDANFSNTSFVIEKHESLFQCDLFEFESDEYVIFPNGTAYIEVYNKTYNDSFYLIVDDFLRVCAPAPPEDDSSERLTSTPIAYLSMTGVGISMICLLLHLVAFAFVPDLQNLPGYNLASLCISLFMSYLFMIIGQSEQESEHATLCTAAGILTHFFFMASFLWMLVMTFDVFRSILLATGSLRLSSKGFKVKKFVWYSMFTWIAALLFSTAAVIADNMKAVPRTYRPMFSKSCWFENKSSLLAFFGVPVGIIVCLNFLMFGISAYTIFSNRMKGGQESQTSNLKKSHLLYFRLSVIMGVTWITGVLAPVVNVMWLWYIFAALNTFEGLFIFLAFTCTSKVKKCFKNKLCKDRRLSEQNLSPTFQSYCYYANSIEKDLDKVVDSKDKSNATDTIVIHL